MTTVAGAISAASRPPLSAETCLRTAFTSVIGAPDESSSSWSRRFSVLLTPGGGRLVSAELPPVNEASTRSPARTSAASSNSRRAARTERSLGSG